jgi:superfamily I DNA and/or RNA helicase
MYDCNFEHTMLNVQYRMSPYISSFPSRMFYDSKISNGENVKTETYRSGPCLLDRKAYSFLQINGTEEAGAGGSLRNYAEAKCIAKLVCNLRSMMASRDRTWYSADRVRIITFYQAQVGLIKNLLLKENLGKKIVVATVDSSQGCEADIVILSFVRSPSEKLILSKHDAGFLTDNRRMNVALTRAKYQLICVGNVELMQRMVGAETLQRLSEDAKECNAVQPYPTHRSQVNTSLDLFYGPPQKKPRCSAG